MRYGYILDDYERRYRRRIWMNLLKWILAAIVFVAIGAFFYKLGEEQLKQRSVSLTRELAEVRTSLERSEREAAHFQQMARTTAVRVEELELRLQRELPSGPLADLSDMVARKLAEGVDAERLAFVIGQTGRTRTCSPQETKRFVLPTPLYRGANTSVLFADEAVSVTGEGTSAKDAAGNPEAWYDPAAPVILRFALADGTSSEARGVLPLQHSVVSGDREYRFRVNPGARSFVEVVGDTCPFP